MTLIFDILSEFFLGLATSLTAVCVLPLYPAFLTFLVNKFQRKKPTKKEYALVGLSITFGIITFMLIIGILFTTLLQQSLTTIIGIISPIAFFILTIISLFLIFDFNIAQFFPNTINSPLTKNPLLSAFLYGLFFGAIVIPCNPLFIAAFFTRAILFSNFFYSIFNFLFFGLGLGFPLLLFSLISSEKSSVIINAISSKKRLINLIAGIIMLAISLYYLIFVFRIYTIIL